MVEFKFHLQATALVLTIVVLCSTLAQNHVPWFLANVATVPLTASDAFIIDAVHNSTHWVVLDSYFRLRYFTYSATTASLVRTVDISSKMGIGIVDHPNLKSQSDRTASLGINPLGDVFVATYSPFAQQRFSLNLHKVRPFESSTYTRVYDGRDDPFWNSQYRNPRLKLFFEGTSNLYVGFLNYPDGTAKGTWLSRHQYSATGIPDPNNKLPLNNQEAFAIDFECKNAATVCVWTTSRRVIEYSTPGFTGGTTTTTPDTSPALQFDPAIATSAGNSYFFHRMPNETSRFIVHARNSTFASLGGTTPPYIVNNALYSSNSDVQVDGNLIYVGFTSILNSSLGLGNSEIVISQYSRSYHMQSSIILSTARLDSLTRLLPVGGNKLMVVGMTEGDLSNPTLNSGNRRAFVAHFQYFWITSLQTASLGSVRGAESFLIGFSSFPSSATTDTPLVTLNGRPCTVRGWVGQTLNVTAPYGIGGPHELRIVFSYLPFSPSVTNRTLSYPPPVLQSINVTQGPAVGYSIRLDVANLGLQGQDSLVVAIGGKLCRNTAQINVFQLTCITPAGTGRNLAVVVSAGAGLNSTQSFSVSYDPPSFHRIVPGSGPTLGGNEVAIHGKNFGPCASIPCNAANHQVSVTINALPCTNILLWEDNLIRCLAPQGVGTGHPIRVDVDGQQGLNSSVTYAYDIPKISLLVPSTSLSTNPTVYIEGENFGSNQSLVRVRFRETVNSTVYECESLVLKSHSNVRCDFTNSQLPNFATFNVTVVVANQSSVVTSTNKFRTGVANSDPIVFPYSGTMNEDTILVILLNGNDPDPGDSVTFFVSSTPTHGNLYQFSSSALNSRGPIIDTSLSPVAVQDPFARLVYIPFIEFSGMDDFTFLGRDGSNAESTVVSGNITVNPVADPPVPRPLLIEIDEDDATVINFDVQDPDTLGGNLTVILLSIPPSEKGELYEVDDLLNREFKITSAPYNVSNYRKRVLYVPPSNAYGNFFTSFIYRAADESQMSLVNATMTISIKSVNDVPTAENKSYVMLEDFDLTITFECQDADVEDRFAILIESVPPTEAGSLFQTDVRFQAPIYADDRLSRTVVQFKPRENYFGNTSISFRCVDNVSTSEIAFIDIEVRNVNDLPTAPSFSVVSDEDTDVIIPFPLSDIESPVENLTIIVMNLPRRGILHYPVMENGSIIWIPMNETGFVVPDFNHTLMFRPPPDGNGDPFAVFPYLVDDGSDKSSINGTVTIIINAVNDPPSLDISSLSNLSVDEDGELTITMDVRDVDNDNRLWVRITDIRINGSLFHVNRRTGANTRLVVGEGSEIVGPPYQVIFVPSKDFASTTSETYQRFNVTFSDTDADNETNSHEIEFPVVPINDAPRIDCSSPFIILPQDKLNISNTVVNITLFASDVDDTNLDFVISSLPNRGMLVDPSTGSQILLNTPFRNPNIVFNSSGSGAGYPYGNFTVYVKDPSGSRSAQCTFQFTFTCPARTYANIFSNGTGPICTSCPEGASCSQNGNAPPIPNAGYYKLNDTSFLPCIPEIACTGQLSSQCATGYTGFRCGECSNGFYRLNGLCKECDSGLPDWFVPLVAIGGLACLSFLFALMRKGPTRGLVNIILNFIQTVAVFEQFFVSLDFFPALKQTIEAMGAAQLNLELAAPECVVYKYQLASEYDLRYKLELTLLLPLIIAAAVAPVAIFNSYPVLWVYSKIRNLVLSSSAPIDSKLLKARQKDMFLLSIQTYNMILNIIYIVLVSQSLKIFDCTQEADGQYYLDAQPSALCYSDWWYEYAPMGAIGLVFYVIGIPLYFMIMLSALYQTTFYGSLWIRAKEWTFSILDIESSFFKPTRQHFLVIQLIRKLFIVAIKLFLTRYPVMQAVLTTCILCVDLLLSAKYTPYNVKTLNILEVICTMSAIVVMNCGLLIHTGQYISDTDRRVMGVIILILIFTCISITIGIFLIEVKTKIQNQLMQGSISKQSLDESVWASKQIGGDAAPAKLQKTSYLRDAFANIGSRSNSGILHPPLSESPAAVSRAPSTKKYLEVAPNSNGSGMLQRI